MAQSVLISSSKLYTLFRWLSRSAPLNCARCLDVGPSSHSMIKQAFCYKYTQLLGGPPTEVASSSIMHPISMHCNVLAAADYQMGDGCSLYTKHFPPLSTTFHHFLPLSTTFHHFSALFWCCKSKMLNTPFTFLGRPWDSA